jgi:hypothetical protein
LKRCWRQRRFHEGQFNSARYCCHDIGQKFTGSKKSRSKSRNRCATCSGFCYFFQSGYLSANQLINRGMNLVSPCTGPTSPP